MPISSTKHGVLEHVIIPAGIGPNPQQLATVKKSQVRTLVLDLTSYYLQFIGQFNLPR